MTSAGAVFLKRSESAVWSGWKASLDTFMVLRVDTCRSRFSNQIPENLNEQTSSWGLHVTNAFEPLPRQCGFDRAAWLKLGKCAAGHSRVDRPSAFGGKECMTFRAAPSAAQPEISTIRWAFRQERLK